jgi:hypothetical protein
MIERDRKLLARVARANDTAGQVVLAILGDYDRPDPEPARMRALGRELAELGADLLARAAELDGRVIEPPTRVLIDARP